MVSSLGLQMSLYFNTYFFPLWWISSIMMLQMKVSLCFNTSTEISSAHPWHCDIVNKVKVLNICFLFQVSFTVCEILQTCLFLCAFVFVLVFNLAWLLQIHRGHCYHPNNLNWSYQVISGLHGEPTGKGRLFFPLSPGYMLRQYSFHTEEKADRRGRMSKGLPPTLLFLSP